MLARVKELTAEGKLLLSWQNCAENLTNGCCPGKIVPKNLQTLQYHLAGEDFVNVGSPASEKATRTSDISC